MNKEEIVKEIGLIMHMNYAYDQTEDVGYVSDGKLLLIVKFYNQYYRILDYKTRTAGFLQVSYKADVDTLREKLTTATFNHPLTMYHPDNKLESSIFHALSNQRFFDFTLHDGVGFVLTWKENPTFNFVIKIFGTLLSIFTLKAYGYKTMTAKQKNIVESALTNVVCPEE